MKQQKVRTLLNAARLSIAGNAAVAIVKWVTGYYGNSFALIADAIESTSDILASVLLLIGLSYSTKPADEDHPYGHGRAETITTFAVVGFLIISATTIIYQSIININSEQDTPHWFTLIVLGIIIIVKEIFFRIIVRKSKESNSRALQADAWHHRTDALTSLAAFIGISIAIFMGKGYESADDWAALFSGGIIFYHSYKLFRPALGEIMDEDVYEELIQNIRRVSRSVPGVHGTEKCFVRKAGIFYHIDLHVLVNAEISVKEGHDIAHALKDELKKQIPDISNVLIHVEPLKL